MLINHDIIILSLGGSHHHPLSEMSGLKDLSAIKEVGVNIRFIS